MNKIRAIAIGVFWSEGRILAFRGIDPLTREEFFRPFGGGIEFGESADVALEREINEELGEGVVGARLLGVLENRFEYGGKPQHEHVFVLSAEFTNRGLYGQASIVGVEGNGLELRGEWVDPSACGGGQPPLYPTGLRELLLGDG
ncbi:MAG: NUDIX domain-containing protein [Planctomycetota bacterium]|nr:NUDIX domain-containing protein [Planctomycetota bacterium]